EEAKQVESLQKLRLVVVHSTEIYVPLNLNQSPFNVGLPIKLPEFTLEQVYDLARCYELDWANNDAAKQHIAHLVEMVGGHPYLINLAFYELYRGDITLEKLLQDAPTLKGIYGNHLRGYLETFQKRPQLAQAYKEIVTNQNVKLEAMTAYQLESMGLIKLDGDEVKPSCELYRLYFSEQLLKRESLVYRLEFLEQENQKLKNLCYLDELTQLANRRYLNDYLAEIWQMLGEQMAYLSVILCDIDFFKLYNDKYGHLAGDDCLQKVAKTIRDCAKRSSDLAARYGGEEFAIVLPYTDAENAVQIAEEIREKVKALGIDHVKSQLGLPASVITLSLGVASTIPNVEESYLSIVHAADKALYHSKAYGRNRVTLSGAANGFNKHNLSEKTYLT
ncbi:MAG: diguanylate cyclase, partial [Moorea sp. SIO2B7]|nr:diguanylate cyclase [Moorena sp. SIO2B7]